MNYFGIDIGGTAVKYGIVSPEGEVLLKNEYPVSFDQYQTPMLETMVKTSQLFLDKNGVDKSTLKGIGVSATGQIDSTKGIVAGVGGNIKNWEGATLKETLSNLYQLPVTVVNDANCVALAEKWIGRARPYKNAIVVTIGTGVGGGIIVDDKVLLGHRGFGGEVGHFSIERDGLLCTCGNRGCFEQYGSMTALVKKVQAVLPKIQDSILEKEDINGKRIFEWVQQGEAAISKLVDEWIEAIVVGLVSLTHIFNPEIILLGGGVSVQQELFIDKVQAGIKKKVMTNFGKELKVESALLGNQAGLVGAVYYLLQQQ